MPTTSVRLLGLAVEALDRNGRVQTPGEHVGLGFIHKGVELGQFGLELNRVLDLFWLLKRLRIAAGRMTAGLGSTPKRRYG
ncbi:hypothetical protein BCCGELA001_29780 [Bradyrhizobium sp. CCGE-LA001]|nr:hypothetical protein BCCGELA001_29780 [Bradyrhizobium sp. CCGE-LA001]